MRDSIEVHDQMHQLVILTKQPLRIVSLVPSLTELLVDGFQLRSSIVGVTEYCVHPTGIRETVATIGGPKNIRTKQIEALNPDIVIASKEENVREQIEELRKEVPVFVADVVDIPSALEAISLLGKLLGVSQEASLLVDNIQNVFASYKTVRRDLSVAYLIWQDPFMTVSKGTFIHEMLSLAGFRNAFANRAQRYPQIELGDLTAQQPNLVLLASEPYNFSVEDQKSLQKQLPGSKVVPVDGEMFSWYGNRMAKAPAYFKQLFKFVV